MVRRDHGACRRASGADVVNVPDTDVENGAAGTPGARRRGRRGVVVVAPSVRGGVGAGQLGEQRRRGARPVRPTGSERAGDREGGDDQQHRGRPRAHPRVARSPSEPVPTARRQATAATTEPMHSDEDQQRAR